LLKENKRINHEKYNYHRRRFSRDYDGKPLIRESAQRMENHPNRSSGEALLPAGVLISTL
jgi:hypothetical protein